MPTSKALLEIRKARRARKNVTRIQKRGNALMEGFEYLATGNMFADCLEHFFNLCRVVDAFMADWNKNPMDSIDNALATLHEDVGGTFYIIDPDTNITELLHI